MVNEKSIKKFMNAKDQTIKAILERYLDLTRNEGFVSPDERCQCRRDNIDQGCFYDYQKCVPWRVKKDKK